MFLVFILSLSISAGQIIKIPLGTHGGANLLDLTIPLLILFFLFKKKLYLKSPPKTLYVFLLFIIVGIFSLILTPLDLRQAEFITSLLYSLRLFLYLLFAWIFFESLGNVKDIIEKIFLFSGISIATLGLLQFLFFPDLRFLQQFGWDPHYFRTVSTFLDPNFTGAYLALTILLLFKKQNYINKFNRANLIFFIIIFLALLTTFSRSSYLMFLVSGITISFLKKSKILLFSILVLFLVLILGFQIYTKIISQPRNIDRRESASFRLNTWQQGLIIWQKSPLIGVGYNAYRFALKEYRLGPEEFTDSHGASANDSSLLQVAATTGILGLGIFFVFLFITLKSGNIILTSGLIGLIAHSFFANSLFYPPILLWILLTSLSPKK